MSIGPIMMMSEVARKRTGMNDTRPMDNAEMYARPPVRPYRAEMPVEDRRDDGDRRRMGGYGGFVWDSMADSRREPEKYHGNVTDMREYQQRRHGDDEHRQIGFGNGTDHLTRREAEEWVAMMDIPGDKPGEVKHGGRWTLDEIRKYAANYGIDGEQQMIDFYVAANMMYSDYCKVAKEFGLDKGFDFYAKMAKAFLKDTDAVKDKLAVYWENIVKKE